MNRIKDYTGFVGWFAGLGYIVLWPLTADNLSGKPFGASLFCRDDASGVADFLCNSAHPLRMPSGLHAIGFIAAMFVAIRLLAYAVRRSRRGAGVKVSAPPRERISAVLPQPPRKPAPPRVKVKPRTQFGLRGQPQRILQNDDAGA